MENRFSQHEKRKRKYMENAFKFKTPLVGIVSEDDDDASGVAEAEDWSDLSEEKNSEEDFEMVDIPEIEGNLNNSIESDEELDEVEDEEELFIRPNLAIEKSDKLNSEKDLLIYSEFVLSQGLSRCSSQEMDKVMEKLCKNPPSTSCNKVWTCIDDYYNGLLEMKVFYCSECSCPLRSVNSTCSNHKCDLNKIGRKTSSDLSTSTSLFFKSTIQAELQISEFLHEIIVFHGTQHEKAEKKQQEMFRMTGEVRESRKYYEAMECAAEYENKTLVLPVTLYIDGAVPKQLTRSELTSCLIRLESLPKEATRDQRRLIMVGFNESRGGLDHISSIPFMEKIVGNLVSFQSTTIEMKHHGTTWKVRFRLLGLMADYKGYNLICPLPNWMRNFGCMTCVIPGMRINRALSFSADSPHELRTKESTEFHLENKICGFDRAGDNIPIFSLCDPSQFFHDELHILYEGAFKCLLDELYATNSERIFENSKVKPARVEAVEDALRKTVKYTHSNVGVPTLASKNKITGSERKMLGSLTFLMLSTTDAFVHPEYACIVLVFGAINLFLHNELKIAQLGELLKETGRLHNQLEKARCTLKFHSVYFHWVDQIKNFSISMEGSFYEKFHSRMNSFVPKSSSSCEDIAKRVLCQARFSLLAEKSDSKVPSGKTCLTGKMSCEELSKDEMKVIEESGFPIRKCEFFYGAHVKKADKVQKYGACGKNPTKSQKSIVRYEDRVNNLVFFGDCQCFFQYNNRFYTLFNRFATKNFEAVVCNIKTKLSNNNSDIALNVLNLCSKMAPPFEEIIGYGLFVAPLLNISSPSLLIPYQNQKFITITQ